MEHQEQSQKVVTCTCQKCGKLEAFDFESKRLTAAMNDREVRQKVMKMTPFLGATTGAIIYAMGGAFIGGIGDFFGLKKEGISLAKMGVIFGIFAGGARGHVLAKRAVKENEADADRMLFICESCDFMAYHNAEKYHTFGTSSLK
jgi:RNase P subunit RPR2